MTASWFDLSMSSAIDGGAGPSHDPPAPALSTHVELEANLLASEQTLSSDPAVDDSNGHRYRRVLVVSRSADLRYYVRECLRARPQIRVFGAGSRALGELVVTKLAPDLLIVDSPDDAALSDAPAIVLADERPSEQLSTGGAGSERVWLPRPFNAASLLGVVDRLLD